MVVHRLVKKYSESHFFYYAALHVRKSKMFVNSYSRNSRTYRFILLGLLLELLQCTCLALTILFKLKILYFQMDFII